MTKIKQISGLTNELASKALDAEVVKKANNLSDLNATTVRANLGVYSQGEVNSILSGTTHAYSAVDLAARSALSGLKATDRVFVSNDGDGKWALYIVSAITNGSGATSTFRKIADEDIFANALTAEAVKTAYESNANTYAFNNNYKGKLDFITITSATNIDNVRDAANAGYNQANTATTLAQDAMNVATSKADVFIEAKETFSGLHSEANIEFQVNLANPIKQDTIPMVFINSDFALQTGHSNGENGVFITVPYVVDEGDVVTVIYKYSA
jgi:hypothetical protein